jgi:hypothetical protein
MSQKSPPSANWIAHAMRAVADAKTPWAVVAILGLALILMGCAVDTAKVQRTRADLEVLCGGAITTALKMACERAGVSTEGEVVSAP